MLLWQFWDYSFKCDSRLVVHIFLFSLLLFLVSLVFTFLLFFLNFFFSELWFSTFPFWDVLLSRFSRFSWFTRFSWLSLLSFRLALSFSIFIFTISFRWSFPFYSRRSLSTSLRSFSSSLASIFSFLLRLLFAISNGFAHANDLFYLFIFHVV